jgi:integrase
MSGMLYQRGRTWWLKYYQNGRPVRESSGTTKRKVAADLLASKVGKVASGEPVLPSRVDRIVWDEAARDLRVYYATTGKRNLDEAERRFAHLDAFFAGRKLIAIDGALVSDYAQLRQAANAANATINREVSVLKRALRLARQRKKLVALPETETLKERAPRSGFFEPPAFEAVVRRLPEHLELVARIGLATGWRHGELLGLERRNVDLELGTIRLDPGSTKNDDGRVAYLAPELVAGLRAQLERVDLLQRTLQRVIPQVFVHPGGYLAGRPVREFYRAWKTACVAAGVPGRLFHDLRRTAVRNLERAGVPRSVATKITGHRSESVYRRYAIVSDEDLKEAMQKVATSARPPATGTIPGTIAAFGRKPSG